MKDKRKLRKHHAGKPARRFKGRGLCAAGKGMLRVVLCLLLMANSVLVMAAEPDTGMEGLQSQTVQEEQQPETGEDTEGTDQDQTTKAEDPGGDKAENTADPDKDEEGNGSEPEKTALLSVDNQNIYEGMERAYKSGYTPTVTDKEAVIVLPLTAEGELKDNRLTASLDLGDVSASPFVYKNYQKDFTLEEKEINGTQQKKEVYYVRFDLALSSERSNGIYPVVIQISAADAGGAAISQSFTTYVTIANGKSQSGEGISQGDGGGSLGGTEAKPTSAPIVLVSGYTVNPGTVTAGEPFSVDVTLYNTSNKKAVQNMVVTVSMESPDFTLTNDSNTFYIARLGTEESTTLTLTYDTNLNAADGQYTISLAMSYDDLDATTLTSSGEISVSLKQKLRVELTMPAISSTVKAGDTLPLEFQFLNLGRSKVYNVRCDVSGYGLKATSTAFMGDMEPGTGGTASLNLFISSKDMSEGYTGTEKYGNTEGTVTLTYEDAAGEEYTQEYPFQTKIEEPVVPSSGDNQEEEKPAGQWWISVAVLLGILAAAVLGFFLKHRRAGHETV